MVVFISSFQQYLIDTHIYLSFNVSHLIQKWTKNGVGVYGVYLMINVSQSYVNYMYVTNFTISQISTNAS